jgi:hypothetical protein
MAGAPVAFRGLALMSDTVWAEEQSRDAARWPACLCEYEQSIGGE